MQTFHTLTQLLDQAGCQYQIFDLGRRVSPIDINDFKAVEDNRQPYPWPLLQHANLAIAFWQQDAPPWIWFLRLPLDERGLLKQAAIGDFIRYVSEAMGASLSSTPTEEEQQKLAANPYTFKPKDDKMAIFHAHLRHEIGMACSQYYEHAQHYLTGDLGWNNWQGVGLQGIAEICARLKQENNTTLVRRAVNKIPLTPLYALLGSLEHCILPDSLLGTLSERLYDECRDAEPDLFLIAAILRAMSGANESDLHSQIQVVLAQSRLCHHEILIAIAGRCWNGLKDISTAALFLQRLAENGDQTLFNQIFADLVMVPALRGTMLQVLHTDANPALIQAIEQLQQQTKGEA